MIAFWIGCGVGLLVAVPIIWWKTGKQIDQYHSEMDRWFADQRRKNNLQ